MWSIILQKYNLQLRVICDITNYLSKKVYICLQLSDKIII